jgi:hypothetical protein
MHDPFNLSLRVFEAVGCMVAQAVVDAEWEAGTRTTVDLDDPEYDCHEGSRRWDAECAERATHVPLVRDIVGNPFCPAAFSPTWRNEATLSLAHFMYGSGDFSAMPILGDALEEAGCSDADVLAHCRGPGPHVRGCWVVDELLEMDRYPPDDWITPANYARIHEGLLYGYVTGLLGGSPGDRTGGKAHPVGDVPDGLPGRRWDWIGPKWVISIWAEDYEIRHKLLRESRPVSLE